MKSAGIAPADPSRPLCAMAGAKPRGPAGCLAGRLVLVTRPREQSAALVSAIEAAGGKAQVLPSLAIGPVADSAPLDAALADLPGYDLVVFVSVNAVREAVARCAVLGLPGLGGISLAAAPGPATAAALGEAGAGAVVTPAERFDSAGLIAELSARACRPRRALILRGMDDDSPGSAGAGREELGRWLGENGASVDMLACYRRVWARLGAAQLATLVEGPVPDAAIVASSEGARALAAMLGSPGRAWLAGVPMFVPHERIARTMAGLGFAAVHVTAGGDAGMMRGLVRYFAGGVDE